MHTPHFGTDPHDLNNVATTFLRWTFLRAVFHRGYVLVSQLYFVVTAEVSASQLLVLGTVVAVTMLLSDLPTGLFADTRSRRWSLVAGHVFLAAGMAMTGLVTSFPLLVLTQVLWGVGWAFSTGADVAWLTDELDQPDRVARVLTARARWDLVGQATGTVAFGLLGWAIGLATAVVVSGVGMALLGGLVAVRFTEHRFVPIRERRLTAALATFRQGLDLAGRDREIRLVLVATLLIHALGTISWLYPKRLVDLGFPSDPVLSYTVLSIVSYAVGAGVLRLVEARIDRPGIARRAYALACVLAALGMIALAVAPNALVGCVAVLLVAGVAGNVSRAVSVVWVNRRTPSAVRATVHSFLSQAEKLGSSLGGTPLAALAQVGIPVALLTAAALHAVAGVVVARSRADRL